MTAAGPPPRESCTRASQGRATMPSCGRADPHFAPYARRGPAVAAPRHAPRTIETRRGEQRARAARGAATTGHAPCRLVVLAACRIWHRAATKPVLSPFEGGTGPQKERPSRARVPTLSAAFRGSGRSWRSPSSRRCGCIASMTGHRTSITTADSSPGTRGACCRATTGRFSIVAMPGFPSSAMRGPRCGPHSSALGASPPFEPRVSQRVS